MHDGDPRGQLRPNAIGDGACTGCHRELAATEARARHSHHGGDRQDVTCVDCHMPRVVYGVLDVHRSHRIEVPDPARAAAFGRPDACTGCHADETPAWAAAAVRRWWGRAGDAPASPIDAAALAGTQGPGGKLLSGDPIERAVAADALGRTRAPAATPALAVRAGLLLDAMANDDYPAVRYLAARALGRLSPSRPALAAYDPFDDRAGARGAAVERVRASLSPPSVVAPDAAQVRRLRATATAVAIDIGE
jgi:hypothetical protein